MAAGGRIFHAPRFVIQGAKACWRKDFMDCQETPLKNGMKAHNAGFGVEAPDQCGTLTTYRNGRKTVRRNRRAGDAPACTCAHMR
jgi:hypothetical protein